MNFLLAERGNHNLYCRVEINISSLRRSPARGSWINLYRFADGREEPGEREHPTMIHPLNETLSRFEGKAGERKKDVEIRNKLISSIKLKSLVRFFSKHTIVEGNEDFLIDSKWQCR